MDVMKRLQSLLSPPGMAANRSQPRLPKAEVGDHPTFAERLKSAAKVDQGGPQIVSASRPGAEKLAADSGPTPSILPGNPDSEAKDSIAIEPVSVQIGDTLESVITKETDRVVAKVVAPAPETEVAPTAAEATPVALNDAAAAVTIAPKVKSTVVRLPEIGINWSPLVLRGSGASGHGIAGTDAATATDLVNKHEYYNNPGKYGLRLNAEARMFLDAVDKGYVPNTPEGLGTLLANLSKGTMGPNARDPQVTAYFHSFFAADKAAAMG